MNPEICESTSLEAFLEGTLSHHQEMELEKHLGQCSNCAQKIEQLAADSSRWNNVRFHLERPKGAATPPDVTDSFPMPFAVQQVLAQLDPTDDPESLGRLGNYEVLGVVGNGAMGVVLKAFEQTLDRVVALKVMNPTLAACGTARHRFAREAKAAAAVLHPNVIAIHGVSTDRDLPYLVMPYIAGTSLQQRMNRQGPLPLIETLRIGSQIAAGLAAAHQQGLIHRDIKPSNVMLDTGVETAIITDFGLARTIDDATMTRSGSITGTPEYMSPEQARGDSVDCSSDVFSLGSVLYALCTGKRPFRAKTQFGLLRKIADENATTIREINSDIPVWFCNLIEEMHSKHPDERPSSSEVRDLLESCLAHLYQPDRIPLPKELSKHDSRRVTFITRSFLTGALAVMSIVFIAILAVAMLPGNSAPEGEMKIVSLENKSSEIKSSNDPAVFKTLKLMFPKQGQKGVLEIDIQRGFIDVTGHDQPGVAIEILMPPGFEKSADQDSQLSKIFAPKYDLDTDVTKNLIKLDTYNQDYALNLRIKVPRATDLSLDSYINDLRVKNVSGTIHTHSEHGDISLLDIAGSATAFSRNGNLTVRFQNVGSSGMLDFESYNGAINLSLPKSIATTTAISSGIGSYQSAFEIAPLDESDRPKSILNKVKSNVDEYQFGKINGGGIPLRIESENGRIKILKTSVEARR